MQKFLQLTRPRSYEARYRIANGAHVLEAPLTTSQRQALALARNEPERYPLRPSQTVRVDATAGGRFQGFRVP